MESGPHNALGGGVPSIADLLSVEKSDLFRELERASRSWFERNSDLLEPYAKRWVDDPLHQWSRRWEYPFVAEALARSATRTT